MGKLKRKQSTMGNIALVVFFTFLAMSFGFAFPAQSQAIGGPNHASFALNEQASSAQFNAPNSSASVVVFVSPVTSSDYSNISFKIFRGGSLVGNVTAANCTYQYVASTVYSNVYQFVYAFDASTLPIGNPGTEFTLHVYNSGSLLSSGLTFTVWRPPTYTPPPTPPPAPPRDTVVPPTDGGGGSQQQTQTQTQTPTTPPVVTSVGGPMFVAPVAMGVGTVLPAAAIQAAVATIAGQTVAQIVVSAVQALQAFQAAPAAQPSVIIQATQTANAVQASIPNPAALIAAVQARQGAIEVQAQGGDLAGAAIAIPATLINISSLATQLGTTAANVTLNVNIAPAPQAVATQATAAASAVGAVPAAPIVEFSITASSASGTVALNNFNTYVPRSLPVTAQGVTAANGVGVRVEGSTLVPVPCTFSTVNGQTVATILSNSTSAYTVIKNTKSFKDVANHPAKADIEMMASKMILAGITSDTFVPDGKITRGQMAAIFTRAFGLKTKTGATKFSDVKAADWFAGAVGAAADAKLISGVGANAFKPAANITNQEMAVMLVNGLKLAGQDSKLTSAEVNSTIASFSDGAKIAPWAKTAVATLVKKGVIAKGGSFAPGTSCTRGQSAVLIKKTLSAAKFM